jgi:hypothetical protein
MGLGTGPKSAGRPPKTRRPPGGRDQLLSGRGYPALGLVEWPRPRQTGATHQKLGGLGGGRGHLLSGRGYPALGLVEWPRPRQAWATHYRRPRPDPQAASLQKIQAGRRPAAQLSPPPWAAPAPEGATGAGALTRHLQRPAPAQGLPGPRTCSERRAPRRLPAPSGHPSKSRPRPRSSTGARKDGPTPTPQVPTLRWRP